VWAPKHQILSESVDWFQKRNDADLTFPFCIHSTELCIPPPPSMIKPIMYHYNLPILCESLLSPWTVLSHGTDLTLHYKCVRYNEAKLDIYQQWKNSKYGSTAASAVFLISSKSFINYCTSGVLINSKINSQNFIQKTYLVKCICNVTGI
jgi:hypothetical protein